MGRRQGPVWSTSWTTFGQSEERAEMLWQAGTVHPSPFLTQPPPKSRTPDGDPALRQGSASARLWATGGSHECAPPNNILPKTTTRPILVFFFFFD